MTTYFDELNDRDKRSVRDYILLFNPGIDDDGTNAKTATLTADKIAEILSVPRSAHIKAFQSQHPEAQ